MWGRGWGGGGMDAYDQVGLHTHMKLLKNKLNIF